MLYLEILNYQTTKSFDVKLNLFDFILSRTSHWQFQLFSNSNLNLNFKFLNKPKNISIIVPDLKKFNIKYIHSLPSFY